MSSKFKKKQVELSFRKFSDYASDVLSSDNHTFETRFNIFIHHCENDRVMSIICNQLKNVDINFDEWVGKAINTGYPTVGRKRFDLPVDEIKRDALFYHICLKVNKGEIALTSFSREFFGATSLNAVIQTFNEAVVKPMERSIGYKLEEIMYDVETELGNKRYIPINILYIYQDFSTSVNGDVDISGDGAIGNGAKIEKKSIF